MNGITRAIRRLTICTAGAFLFLVVAVPAHPQSIGIRPGVAAYAEQVGFEMMVEGRFRVPLFERGPGSLTASALLGYSRASVDTARKDGFMVAAATGYEIPLGAAGLAVAPGFAAGVEFSQFTEAQTENEVAPMLFPYAEVVYRFDFGLAVGLQTGLKMLFYGGETGGSERSLVLGPVISYAFGN